FIIPLISYAILATVAAGILWFRTQQKPPHPLEVMPDVDGEFPTYRKGNKKQVRDSLGGYKMPVASMNLPDSLKVDLGKSLTLGELEVTPLRLEVDRVTIKEIGREQPETPLTPSLKLYLRFKNLS